MTAGSLINILKKLNPSTRIDFLDTCLSYHDKDRSVKFIDDMTEIKMKKAKNK